MVLAHGVLSPTKKARTTAQKICNNQLEKKYFAQKIEREWFFMLSFPPFPVQWQRQRETKNKQQSIGWENNQHFTN